MHQTRKQQEQDKSKTPRDADRTQGANRSAPQPIDDKLLKQISGGGGTYGNEAPRGNW